MGAALRATALTLFVWAVACGGVQRPAAPPPMQPRDVLGHVPVGARWVLAFRADQVLTHAGALTLVRATFPAARLARWSASTALDPRGRRTATALSQIVVAQYPDGVLLVAPRLDGPPPPQSAPFLFGDHVVAGAISGDPVAWKGLSRALSDRDDARLDRQQDPALSDLSDVHAGAPVAVYFPEPLALPPESGLGAMMAHQRAMAVTLGLPSDGRLPVTVDLRGRFPPTAPDALSKLFTFVANDSLGMGFGLDSAGDSLRIDSHPDGLLVTFQVDVDRLRDGMARLLGEQLWPEMSQAGVPRAM